MIAIKQSKQFFYKLLDYTKIDYPGDLDVRETNNSV